MPTEEEWDAAPRLWIEGPWPKTVTIDFKLDHVDREVLALMIGEPTLPDKGETPMDNNTRPTPDQYPVGTTVRITDTTPEHGNYGITDRRFFEEPVVITQNYHDGFAERTTLVAQLASDESCEKYIRPSMVTEVVSRPRPTPDQYPVGSLIRVTDTNPEWGKYSIIDQRFFEEPVVVTVNSPNETYPDLLPTVKARRISDGINDFPEWYVQPDMVTEVVSMNGPPTNVPEESDEQFPIGSYIMARRDTEDSDYGIPNEFFGVALKVVGRNPRSGDILVENTLEEAGPFPWNITDRMAVSVSPPPEPEPKPVQRVYIGVNVSYENPLDVDTPCAFGIQGFIKDAIIDELRRGNHDYYGSEAVQGISDTLDVDVFNVECREED